MKNLLISIMALLCCGMLSAQSTEPIVHEFDPKTQDGTPFRWSVAVPEGNWTVSVVIGSKKHPASTVVRAESSRLMVEETETAKGKFETVTFTVNRRDPEYPGNYVRLKADVAEKLNWDDSLNLAMDSIRRSVHDLRDDAVNMEEAIRMLIKDFTFCPVDFSYDCSHTVPKDVKYSFISITKEALANVIRHSNATKVTIRLREHPALYQLCISDNGAGSCKASSGNGMGLANMKERIIKLNGQIHFHTENGFQIWITVPKEAKHETDARR